MGYVFSILQIVSRLAYLRSALADGLQAVYNGVIGALEGLEPEDKYRLLQFAVNILGESVQEGIPLRTCRSIDILPLLSNLLEKNTGNYQKVVQQFLMEFMDRKCKSL